MKKIDLKNKLKKYAPEIAFGTTLLASAAAVIYLTKDKNVLEWEADPRDLVVGEVIGDAKTGEPLYLITERGTFNLTPYDE